MIMAKKQVLIYPASGSGLKVAYHLSNEYEVIAFVDKSEKYKGILWGGHKVVEPSEIKKIDYDLIIISMAWHEANIRNQLLQLGVDEKKIVTFCPDGKITWQDERYAMALACIRYIKERGIKGNVAELGVYQGAFSSFLQSHLPGRKIYLFDTFEGFSDGDIAAEKCNVGKDVFKDTSAQSVLDIMPERENVIIRKGWFPETAKGIDDTFCFVSLDADLYKPILAGLEFFYPRLEHGGYIFIHDFENIRYPGCKDAVFEFCTKYNVNFIPILDRCSSAVITR